MGGIAASEWPMHPMMRLVPALLVFAAGGQEGQSLAYRHEAGPGSVAGAYRLAIRPTPGDTVVEADVWLLLSPIDSTRPGPEFIKQLNGCYRIRGIVPAYRGMLRLRADGEFHWSRGTGGALQFTLNRTVDAGFAITVTSVGGRLHGIGVDYLAQGADTLGVVGVRTAGARPGDCHRK